MTVLNSLNTAHQRASHSTAAGRQAAASTVQQWWQAYKVDGSIAARDSLVEHYLSLVRFHATKIAATMPSSVAKDDLISMGTFGLLDAIEKFDITREIKFETYAVTRIVGAIWDQLRSEDRVPRSARTKFRALETAHAELQRELGRPATDDELAERLQWSVAQVRHTLWLLSRSTVVSLDDPHVSADGSPSMSLAERLPDDRVGLPGDLVEAAEMARLVKNGIYALDERARTVITLYYFEGLTLSEIGVVLGVTESRVCQLHNKAQDVLREQLGAALPWRGAAPRAQSA